MRDFWVSAIVGKTELLEDPGRDLPSNKKANLDNFLYVGSYCMLIVKMTTNLITS